MIKCWDLLIFHLTLLMIYINARIDMRKCDIQILDSRILETQVQISSMHKLNQAEIVTLSLFWKPTIFEYRLFMYSVHSRQQSLRRYNILTTGPTQNMAGRWWCLQSVDRLWASRNVFSLRNCCKQQQQQSSMAIVLVPVLSSRCSWTKNKFGTFINYKEWYNTQLQ